MECSFLSRGLGMFVHRGVRLLGSRSRSQGTTFSKSSQIEEAVLVAVDITPQYTGRLGLVF